MNSLNALGVALLALMVGATHAFAAESAEPFSVQAYGNFKQMAHTGNTDGVVKLAQLPGVKGSYGVGALAGMRGEVLLWDGRMLVSRGHSPKGETGPAMATDQAAIFVGGKVDGWQNIPVPADLSQAQFEAFVLASAKKLGLDVGKAFPFAVKGDKLSLTWHVVTGAASGAAHGSGTHGQGHAQSRIFKESGAGGVLLGFHTGAALEGVASHPGERFHVHYANADFSRSGHVDEYRVPSNAMLMLPKR